MALTDRDYNGFASVLAARVALRAKGLDESGRRLVAIRPADHVLTGFLTPAAQPSGSAESSLGPAASAAPEGEESLEVSAAEDLPRDSAYEQTAVGLEWLAPAACPHGGLSISIRVEYSLYVRRLPTFAEQRAHSAWRVPNQRGPTLNGSASAGTELARQDRQADLVQVWSRETPGPLEVDLDVMLLYAQRCVRLNLGPTLAADWSSVDDRSLYPGRQPIRVAEPDLSSEEAFQAKLALLPAGLRPLEWTPAIDARLVALPTEPGLVWLAIRLVNQTRPADGRTLDYVDPNLYGVGLTLTLPRVLHRPALFRELPASFRYDRTMPAIGINSHVSLREDGEKTVLSVDTVPMKTIDRLQPREVGGPAPTFENLFADPIPCLKGVLAEMGGYDAEQWAAKIAALEGIEKIEAEKARIRFREEIQRFERGLAVLQDGRYELVRRSFSLMNQAMAAAVVGFDRWRLFQIVFIVSQLPLLAAREYSELEHEGDDDVDILWFAAGGGKTEAFLGLTLWQAFFDRLRGKTQGVAAVIRFPLRLLTFQQLQRIARGLASAEVLRVKKELGGQPFSIGYFSGRAVTPNVIDDETHHRFIARGVDPRFQRMFVCPFPGCGGLVELTYGPELRRIEHSCRNASCPGGQRTLPVFVVDDDIYRYLPTVIVSTVDKLALLGQNHRFANIFGRIDFICPKHGATFREGSRLCPAARELGKGQRPERCGDEALDYGPFRDPSPALLIQDELHLLSEELGTFDSHYETGALALARALGAKPWKIIAATATIERYEQHAWHLYLKKARQFPGPGPGAYDSFYYQQDRQRIGRIFVGLLGVGRKHTPAVTRSLSLIYLELQAAREHWKADPEGAAAAYDTAVLSEADVRRLIFAYELPVSYVLTRKGSDQVAEAIESRVKKELHLESPEHGELLVDMFNGGVEISEMIVAMEGIRAADPDGDPAARVRGLVTTNIIGHGVDIDRFNIMVFAGFPRLVAEYIQASARIGRTFPGLSILVATPQSERDRSILDRFGKFHEYLDRLVDPSAVNRWPERALSRTVPGLLCAYLFGVASKKSGTVLNTVERVQQAYGRLGAEALNSSEIEVWMGEAYGIDRAPSAQYADNLATHTRNKYREVVNSPRQEGGRPRSLNTYLGAMKSLRDVDDPGFIRVTEDQDQTILRKFIRG
jgi:hypothetical protein